ncbi:hypothetical protein GLOIN_2v1590942 [Rhizophagus irregularis DAOM 181602=DAOM 197198]|uniref:Uncharacterized protein n=1 Tax=Rhizophagus irregularis (strain DAOM 181602 / DAOM 197198 / MUCL 43194) TaxID=747089 RepID=A0A2P4Q5V2_RHIID|nr:hypothetical protein GLOIN_2v1590942 [Rhizophagus irregularis DAOM 181602=DAOM 197198]POG72958.1 hypothetical protein GLOIN_2v1590942 [Rhizophagus irregularis DAOM 181602=DAOM 197198]|eukprot:XP_025179824.1 hypothetical protein GLOIN_2v1590942 [Rhizophagus irregularis DAOM 181602=DAOM 197198]
MLILYQDVHFIIFRSWKNHRNSFKNQVVHEFIGGNFNLNRNFYHTIIILFYYF